MISSAIRHDVLPPLKPPAERRLSFRTRTIYRLVKIRCRGRQGFGRVRNISDGGMCLETQVPITLKDRIEIFLTNDLSLEGKVVWTASSEIGVQFKVPVNCRDLLAEATQRCLRNGSEPLTLKVDARAAVCCERNDVQTVIREISPLHLRLDPRPELSPGVAGSIALPSGAVRRGVIRCVQEGHAIFLLCEPLKTDEVGYFDVLE